jgi:hypothetical protein
MHAKQSTPRTAGPMNHPEPAEWMELLYGESTGSRKKELEAHLAKCAHCAEQIKDWQGGARSLDAWVLPETRSAQPWVAPAVKWAAAAALVLLLGFLAGRVSGGNHAELAALKNSIAQLSEQVEKSNAATLNAANDETVRLLAAYTRVQDARQSADKEALGLALADFRTRLTRLRAELETVAVNTETGFQETHDSLDRVVAISSAAQTSPPDSTN